MAALPNLDLERRLWRTYGYVAGVDEAGRGAWAGPVVAGAVILPSYCEDLGDLLASVRDSKLLAPAQRARCYDLITAHAVAYAVGSASSGEIDRLGIVPATRLAMARAIRALAPQPDYLIIDALSLPALDLPQYAPTKADLLHLSVSAASIVAKVTRDCWMSALADPGAAYGYAQHKGYGTSDHAEALAIHGPSCHHRRSFAPIQALLAAQDGRPA